MTKKLINRIVYLIIIYIIIFKLHPYWISCKPAYIDMWNGLVTQSTKEEWPITHRDSIISNNMNGFKEYYYVVYTLFYIVLSSYIILSIFNSYINGKYDKFFAKYTDPKLQQFCNWVNRRNKTEC